MPDGTKENEAFDKFSAFMQSYLFGLLAVIERPTDGQHFPLASAVAIESHGQLVLLTAAHFLKDVNKWIEQNRLSELSLLVHDKHDYARIPIPPDRLYGSFTHDFDVGCLLLDPETICEVFKNGGIPMKRDALSVTPEEFNCFFLIGHMSAYCKLETQTVASRQEGKMTTHWRICRPNEMAIGISQLKYERKGNARGTFRFALMSSFSDYSGASGGPIIAFKDGAKVSDYCLFGIQSEQVRGATAEQKPTHVIATSSVIAIHTADDYIREVLAKVKKIEEGKRKNKKKP